MQQKENPRAGTRGRKTENGQEEQYVNTAPRERKNNNRPAAKQIMALDLIYRLLGEGYWLVANEAERVRHLAGIEPADLSACQCDEIEQLAGVVQQRKANSPDHCGGEV